MKDPERLVVLDGPGIFSGSTHNQLDTLTPLSHPMFIEIRDKTSVFEGALGHYSAPLHLTVGGQTEKADGALVSGTFFDVLGLQPAAGRLFTADDDRLPGGHRWSCSATASGSGASRPTRALWARASWSAGNR